ncbi:MAG: alpha-hydroxy-acid oxidizing protein [Nitrososphaeria archaeon]|jgi:isopentenyl diphosphate isomerase/L-lactate dehydrogenase-like FMN-dependent dehydrogenase
MNYSELVEVAFKRLEELGLHDAIRRFKGEPAGCESGYTSVTNRKFFDQISFKMRLIDSKWADTSTELFGQRLKTPVVSGAMSGMANLEKEPLRKIAWGLAEAGSMIWVGICSNEELELVFGEKAPVVVISKPWIENEKIIERIGFAEDLGAVAVGVDIDHSFGPKSGDEVRLKDQVGPKTLDDLKNIISTVHVPFVIKGVLSVEDAIKAGEVGAKSIVVSNHMGSTIDYAANPLQILPKVVEATSDKLVILVDSGFRRGTDVLKGLALGAKGVLMGTNIYMGLAANGANGVRDMIVAVTDELRRAMSLTGCAKVDDITSNILIS